MAANRNLVDIRALLEQIDYWRADYEDASDDIKDDLLSEAEELLSQFAEQLRHAAG